MSKIDRISIGNRVGSCYGDHDEASCRSNRGLQGYDAVARRRGT